MLRIYTQGRYILYISGTLCAYNKIEKFNQLTSLDKCSIKKWGEGGGVSPKKILGEGRRAVRSQVRGFHYCTVKLHKCLMNEVFVKFYEQQYNMFTNSRIHINTYCSFKMISCTVQYSISYVFSGY